MNGPEHYAAAELLLRVDATPGLPGGPVRAENLAAAQVHATLALTAATIDTAQIVDGDIAYDMAWNEATK
jgi:hypothetical protein